MTSWKIELEVPQEMIPAVADSLADLDPDDLPTLADFEIVEGDSIRMVEAFFLKRPDLAVVRAALQRRIPALDLTLSGLAVTEIADADWVSESQKLLQPVDTGHFFVYGSHDAHRVPLDRISLLVEAGQAFGTGQHETTHGCLLALSDLGRRLTGPRAPQSALDLGCGSGLLALAMSRLWPITVVASDIDPIATETTIQNARANDVAVVALGATTPGIAAMTSDSFTESALDRTGPFDVITANILAGPLQEMAPDIARHLSGDGALILSGLLATQEAAVCAAYARQGLTLHTRYPRGEWHSLLLTRE